MYSTAGFDIAASGELQCGSGLHVYNATADTKPFNVNSSGAITAAASISAASVLAVVAAEQLQHAGITMSGNVTVTGAILGYYSASYF